MRRYVGRRVAAFVATLFFVSAFVFVVVRLLPGDPATLILGVESTPETLARLRHAMGLDRPLALQYVDWPARLMATSAPRSSTTCRSGVSSSRDCR